MKPHFSQHERVDFSTRALKSKKIATLFQLKKRRYLDRKSDAFFGLFRTIRKTHPNAFEYQCVATAIFAREICQKNYGCFSAFFSFAPSMKLELCAPKHRCNKKNNSK